MERISLTGFEQDHAAYDQAVRDTPGIDRFCSGSDWILSAHAAWAGRTPVWILQGDHGFAIFLEHVDPDGTRVLLSFDTMWGFSCPLAGGDPAALARELAAHFEATPAGWQVALVTGLSPGSELFQALAHSLSNRYVLRYGSPLRRWLATLEGSVDGYLGRRSAKFRESLRRSERKAKDEGIEMVALRIDSVAGAEKLFHRVLAVEEKSWKGPAETGLLLDELQDFYREISIRWARRGALRAILARQGGEDVGYILGGTLDSTYRGFQFSFDRRLDHLSLGNLMQIEQIRELCEEGFETYDLGIDMDYKRRWAETTFDTVTLAVLG